MGGRPERSQREPGVRQAERPGITKSAETGPQAVPQPHALQGERV